MGGQRRSFFAQVSPSEEGVHHVWLPPNNHTVNTSYVINVMNGVNGKAKKSQALSDNLQIRTIDGVTVSTSYTKQSGCEENTGSVEKFC